MKTIQPDSLSNITFELEWEHEGVYFNDLFFGRKINFWRDCLPPNLYEKLLEKPMGEKTKITLGPKDGVPIYLPENVREINSKQFGNGFTRTSNMKPQSGRFYPQGILNGIPGVFASNEIPFRCLDVTDDTIRVDLNHPLAGKKMRLSVQIKKIIDKLAERGGSCTDWLQVITGNGPGMQGRINGHPTDFFSEEPFTRTDERKDLLFYERPRFVHHIDATAIGVISDIYKKLLTPDKTILDLMSSWVSHLPKDVRFKRVTGLGMNRAELEKNNQLTDAVVHDLNENPQLPFDEETYDAVICTVSVEYLTRPFDVFADIARILKPEGLFIVTFSNRWFSPKAVNIWKEPHEFERMGLVTEYFLNDQKYTNIHAHSVRGLLRPGTDKYYPNQRLADPVYCVWGKRI